MKYKLIVIFFFFCVVSNAQDFKNERRIFVWDVTLSMWGYNASPDIGEEVRDNIIKAINEIDDINTDIYVIPFQDNVLDVWKVRADNKGKERITNKIRGIRKKDLNITRTNICDAWDRAVSLLDKDKRNYIFLLTDGKHNSETRDKDCFIDSLDDWSIIAKRKDGYAFFVMLTDIANDPEITSKIQSVSRIDAVSGTSINITEVDIQEMSSINILENQKKVEIKVNTNHKIPDGFKVRIKAKDNPYYEINSEVELKNGKIFINPKPKMTKDQLKEKLPEEYIIPIEVIIDREKHPRMIVVSTDNKLRFVNKKEKVLYINVVK